MDRRTFLSYNAAALAVPAALTTYSQAAQAAGGDAEQVDLLLRLFHADQELAAATTSNKNSAKLGNEQMNTRSLAFAIVNVSRLGKELMNISRC